MITFDKNTNSEFWDVVSKDKDILTDAFVSWFYNKLNMVDVFQFANLKEKTILDVIENMDTEFYDNNDIYLPIILKYQNVSEDFKRDFDCN
jgi:hypothetical protein